MATLIPNALIPSPLTARAKPNGRWGRVFGFGLTARALLLLLAGLLAALPAFYHPGRLWIMLAWDAVVAGLIAWDAWLLPAPGQMEVTRSFVQAPAIGEETEIAYTVVQDVRWDCNRFGNRCIASRPDRDPTTGEADRLSARCGLNQLDLPSKAARRFRSGRHLPAFSWGTGHGGTVGGL